MELSEYWLRKRINSVISREEILKKLTMIGLEVEAVNAVVGNFSGVVIAQVIKTTKHPAADKLSLCEVDAGDSEILKIVCGAKNVRANLKVALALDGAVLPSDIKIKTTTLRGEISQGMLCSAKELGWNIPMEGILELPDDAPIGVDLREYFNLDDVKISLNVTPNRADCMSYLGVARDLAVVINSKLKTTPNQVGNFNVAEKVGEQIEIINHLPEVCPLYCGRVISNIDNTKKTPFWLQDALQRIDINLINPVVDILNWVMHDLGQPMHAYNAAYFPNQIHIRKANIGEKINLLNGNEVLLHDSTIVIANKESACALAGIMGGLDSSVETDTTSIWLESAVFQPSSMAGVARTYGLSTDASQRFERGVDHNYVQIALEQATAMIIEILGGEAGPVKQSYDEIYIYKTNEIIFRPSSVKKLVGIAVDADTSYKILSDLGLKILIKDQHWQVTPPTYRKDLQLEADLVEEIVRIVGYNAIISQTMHGPLLKINANFVEDSAKLIRNFFKVRGFNEVINYAFTDSKMHEFFYPDLNSKKLLNPISVELSEMRLGLIPGLVKNMQYNCNRQHNYGKFFEMGIIFVPENDAYQEYQSLAGLIYGNTGTDSWADSKYLVDFYDLKGDLEALFKMLNIKVDFMRAEQAFLHPSRSADIYIKDSYIGYVGALHPKVVKQIDQNHTPVIFELNLNKMFTNNTVKKYSAISKFPKITRDLALLADVNISYGQIEDTIKALFSADVNRADWLQSISIFDLYQGEHVPAGKKSLAISITLQALDRTLLDEDVNSVITAILNLLETKWSIILRS